MSIRQIIAIFVFPVLLFSTALNYRLRLGPGEVHIGGAELAIAPYDLMLLLLFLLMVRSGYSRCTRKNIDGLNFAAILFVVFSFLSIINSTVEQFTIYEAIRQIKVLFLFLILRKVFVNINAIKALSITAVILVFIELAYALVQLSTETAETTEDAAEVKEVFVEGGLTRVSGTLRHPNLLGLYLNLLLPFTVIGAISFKRSSVFVLGIICTFLTILLTYSRTQIIFFFFILASCLFVFRTSKGKSFFRDRRIIFGSIAVAVVTVGLIVFNLETLYTRFFEAPESNTSTRLVLADIAVSMFSENPIIGVGWNTFVDVMSSYDRFGAARSFPYPVHNMYLLVLSETGLLGLFGYLFLLYVVYRYFKRILVQLVTPLEQNIAKASCIALVVILLTGLQGWSFRTDSIQALMWMNFAIIAALYDRTYLLRRVSFVER